ncbi:MAG: AAA family ATPase [Actinomycetota bacterium]|nr:AAA family ATPase [Actinomycetota bacterium]
MAFCRACGSSNPAESTYCGTCGAKLALDADGRTDSARRIITAVFCDVVGSTSLAEKLDPEPYRKVLTAFFDEMAAVVERHGGSVEKFVGDGVKASFGLVRAHEDDALRAVRAAVEMREALARLNEEVLIHYNVALSARTGINTGEVLTPELDEEAFAVGDPINVAARLEQAALPGQILMGESTYRLVRDAVEVEATLLELKGKSNPVTAYALLRVASDATGVTRDFTRPVVGRAEELARIHDGLARVIADESCKLVLVVAGPGVGKSRLLREAAETAQPRARVLAGATAAYGDAVTYSLVVEMLKQAAGIHDQDDERSSESKVAAVVGAHQHASLIIPRVCQLLGVSEVTTTSDEIFWAVRKFLEVVAREQPTLVLIEDLHWAESPTLQLLEHITDWWGGGPLLIICSTRPEFVDDHPNWSRKASALINLTPLNRSDSEQLMRNILGDLEAGTDTAAHVAEVTGGNPLFIEQMLSMLIEEGAIHNQGGKSVLVAPLELSIPPSIHALLTARLDALSREERAVLEAGAVAGGEFSRAAVEDLTPELPSGELRVHLHSLVTREFIAPLRWEVPGAETFRFRHALIRDAAYRAISRERRAQLHERLGEWLEARRGRGIDEPEEVIGHHFEQAYENLVAVGVASRRLLELARRAGEHLAAAGLEAHARHDMPSASAILSRAVQLLARLGPVPFRVLAAFTDALVFSDRAADSQLAITELERAAELGDSRAQAELLLFRSHQSTRWDVFGTAEPIRESEQALKIFDALDDDEGLARAGNYLAYLYAVSGNEEAALVLAGKTLGHARKIHNVLEEGWARRRITSSMLHGLVGVREALQAAEEFVEWSRVVQIRANEGEALAALARAQAYLGLVDAAADSFRLAKTILHDVGGVPDAAVTGLVSYDIAQCVADPRRGEQDLQRSLASLSETGETGVSASIAVRLASLLLEQRRYDEAEELAEEAQRLAAPDDWDVQIRCGSTLGRVLAHRGDVSRGERILHAALERVRQTDWLFLQADLLANLAEVIARGRRHEEAFEQARRAFSLYKTKEHTAGARRVEHLMDQLRLERDSKLAPGASH